MEKSTTPSVWSWAHDFVFGPTPQSPEEKMKEIETRMATLHKKLDTERDIKRFDLNRSKTQLDAAAKKGDETKVREVARDYVRLDKLYRSADARYQKVTERINCMTEMGVGGQISNDTIEYMQAHNKLMARSANPRAVAQTVGQFTVQSEALKLSEEIMEEAMHVSEDEEQLYADSKAVEALVAESMSKSNMALLEKLPSICGVDSLDANNHGVKNIALTAKNIEQFLEKK